MQSWNKPQDRHQILGFGEEKSLALVTQKPYISPQNLMDTRIGWQDENRKIHFENGEKN